MWNSSLHRKLKQATGKCLRIIDRHDFDTNIGHSESIEEETAASFYNFAWFNCSQKFQFKQHKYTASSAFVIRSNSLMTASSKMTSEIITEVPFLPKKVTNISDVYSCSI